MIRGGRERIRLLACAALLVPLGVGSKLYTGPLEGWVRDSAGGFLYVMFWVFALLAAAPRLRAGPVCIGVFLVTSTLEFLQLWHPPLLTAVRSTFLGHALLGSTFSGSDFLYYAAGCVAAYAASRRVSASW
ncbi:MAG TPA: DUF2809 domain-containing protein [Myxococcota bacterium]|nr:DUF2809 domain-containing protein [Myxococcota bacterium]